MERLVKYVLITKLYRMLFNKIFFLFVGIVCGYNIDTDFPIIYSHEIKNSNSYFGYTVHLYYEPVNDTAWLIVGAPKGNYSRPLVQKLSYLIEPGVVYRCLIKNNECQEIKPQKIENEEGYISQLRLQIIIRKQRGWFGSAISIDELNGILTVCAPRIVVTIFNPFKDGNLDTMQGICYSGKIYSNALVTEDNNLAFHDFKSSFWYNPVHGFSVHYASVKRNKDWKEGKLNRIIGEPKHENFGTVEILYSSKRMNVELPISDELSQFGYSVQSGYFFKKDQLLFASGAPGWHYVGLVAIINPASNITIVSRLHGTDIGEFFGASLAVGDLNNDGLDDLLIGAPYWGEDNGKVYAYFGTSKGQFELASTLQGIAKGGHFGYAIVTGDLDADGFDDIIVGAPWEEDGVIYIYNGGPDLTDTNLQVSERIEAAKLFQFHFTRKMQRFGFSISKPVDIDRNGYLDIAVGAYKSQHALILRGKPVIKTELVIQTVPNTLQRDAKQFLLKICPKFTGFYIRTSVQEYKITITIDERYQRTKETVLELKASSIASDTCLSSQVNISKNIRDFIEPISILAKHDFIYDNASSEFCKFCPVERKNNKQQTTQALLSFNIGCGEDKVCNSNISAIAKFHNVRYNDTWVIGSNDISLEISLENNGEPAYLTTLEFKFPERVVLRSILPSCQEDTSNENLIVVCDTGNPIWKGEEKNVKLDLDMRHLINGSLYDNKLYFHVMINTRSINRGTTNLVKTLNLVSEVSLSLHGKANEEAYYLTTLNEAAPNISFQHTYQVYKLGASPIENAQLIVKVPLIIKDSITLIHVYKPQLYVSGELFECSSKSTLLDTQSIEGEAEPSSDQFNISMFSNKMKKAHARKKRELEESYLWLYDVENIKAPQAVNESLLNDIIYMNCSTPEVYCTTIVCDLNALKTLQDIRKLVIKLLLDVDKLKDTFRNNRAVLKFTTEATVEMIKPDVRLDINGTRSTMEVVTMFYDTPKMEKLQLWIVLVSVLVGLLLLLIFVAILSTMGFFKRKGKQDLTNSKNNEVTENEVATTIEPENT